MCQGEKENRCDDIEKAHVVFRGERQHGGTIFRVKTVEAQSVKFEGSARLWREGVAQMLGSHSFGQEIQFEINPMSERWLKRFAEDPRLKVGIIEREKICSISLLSTPPMK